jgi:hypothetical protein
MRSADHHREANGELAGRRRAGSRPATLSALGWASAAGNAAVQRLARAVDTRRGAGAPLEPGLRRRLERSVRQDLRHVRLHRDASADALARAARADAVTSGSDVFFRGGRGGPQDGRLVLHEVAHTLQSRVPGDGGPARLSRAGDPAERQADAIAGGGRPGGSLVPFAGLARQAAEGEEEEVAEGGAPAAAPAEVAASPAAAEEEEELPQ